MQITKHFKRSELECPCCKEMDVKEETLTLLEHLRETLDIPITLTSAYRCEAHNKAVGGFRNSYHKQGYAFDISTKRWDGILRAKLIKTALNTGHCGIGVYMKYIHIDLGGERLWVGE